MADKLMLYIQYPFVRYAIIVAVLIVCGMLCTVAPIGSDKIVGAIVFRGVGIVGIIIGLFFAQRLIREMKKGK